MPGTTVDDGSEDVNDFLLRIRELGDQRDKEDEERTRKLEEEIIQGRKERQARRAERARSLSPIKDTSSNAGTPGSVRSINNMTMQGNFSSTPNSQPPSFGSSGLDDAPRKANGALPNTSAQEASAASRETPQAPSKPQTLPSTSPSATIAPSRAGTLSWQQRPSSRETTGARTRQLSVLASEHNAARPARESETPAFVNDSSMSRAQIAQSLGAKDPTWFKQTHDRGSGSAAFRRYKDDTSDTASMTGNMRLPGMGRESTAESETRSSPPPESVSSSSPSMGGSIQGLSRQSQNPSNSATISSTGGIRSPLPTMASQKFEPPLSDTLASSDDDVSYIVRTLAMSPSQGRISPERMDRSASPTKGLGGFVQSAMMKRSDSVNKRWSAQAGPQLSRGNSVASNASGYGISKYPRGGITPLTESRPNSISRETSPAVNSRPGSGHSNATATQSQSENNKPGTSASVASNQLESVSNDKSGKPVRESKSPPPLAAETTMSPPASPSKRWSPSKSSWLENAINKPDSPRMKMPAPQQPAWMADIARAKKQRGSIDLAKGTNFKEVTIGGLVRSPPPGASHKPPSISGLPSGFSAGVAVKPRSGSSDDLGGDEGTPEVAEKKVGSGTSSPLHARSPKPSSNKMGPSEIKEAALGKEKQQSSPSAKRESSEMGSRTISPTIMKSKPETPPKKDFKSSFKPRPVDGDAGKDEAEFKNVFGKLKRTKTQNYKAPDELRDNIMRGKAGLAQTGGPKRTERKDEFKESILQKKQGMVAPSASTRITSASLKSPDQIIPEAISKKKGLKRSGSILSNESVEGEKEVTKPEALARLQNLRDKPKPAPPETQSGPFAAPQTEPRTKSPLGGTFASSLAGMLQKGPSPMAGKSTPSPSSDIQPEKFVTPSINDEPSPIGPQLTHATKARAKGPKRRLPTADIKAGVKESRSSAPPQKPEQFATENEPGAALDIAIPRSPASSPSVSEPLSNLTNDNRTIVQPSSPRKPSTNIALQGNAGSASPVPQTTIEEAEIKRSPAVKQKPVLSPKNDKRPSTTISTSEPLLDTPSKELNTGEPPLPDSTLTSEKQKREIEPQESDTPLPSVRSAAALWGQSIKPPQSSVPNLPVKLPTRKDEEAAIEKVGLKRKEPVGLDIRTSDRQLEPKSDHNPALPAVQSPKSPPLPSKKPTSIAGLAAPTNSQPPNIAQSSRSTISQRSEASELLADIFEEVPNLKNNANIDTQAIVSSRASDESTQKIKTLRKQISEVTSNGRSLPVPSQQEHVLFENSLYLCTHVFGNPSGQRTTEVYLWCGDGVSSSSVEDAQIFARKVAKENNGKLIILKQGKETSNFFQALGGIVIIRRGSAASSSGPAAAYMLCGRQHVDQIAFDEVDFTPRSLCSGFPYIASTQSGKTYLWKGNGSGAEELGCARLIAMDIGLTGDIEEVDDGKESRGFWESFPRGKRDAATTKATSMQNWKLKPSCERYTTRLFAVDVELSRPKSSSGFMSWGRRGSAPSNEANTAATPQIKEIMPFAQSDLAADGVFVLDAFFEIFIIFTIRSLTPAPQHKSTRSAAFRAALVFAQEYGILAASAEDRPFVPTSSVVICSKAGPENGKDVDNLPEGMIRAFRKWDSNIIRECKVLPLTAALEATG
ncbi:hypothetical protein N7G274_008655 [Stereocaulon virgatum]|uniref:DUF4045 domain-containing protein n=1 Tax=Stereocaulon virgatum TaxID=373712 RepID=A0ABR3ZY29_9LECA